MQIEISENLGQVRDVLRQLPFAMRQFAYEDGLLASSKEIAASARRTTLFKDKTGTLRKSIKARRGLKRYRPSALTITDRTAPHVHLIEFGTKTAAARPFLRKAVEDSRSAQLSSFVQGVRRNFRRITRQLSGQTRLTRKTLVSLIE